MHDCLLYDLTALVTQGDHGGCNMAGNRTGIDLVPGGPICLLKLGPDR